MESGRGRGYGRAFWATQTQHSTSRPEGQRSGWQWEWRDQRQLFNPNQQPAGHSMRRNQVPNTNVFGSGSYFSVSGFGFQRQRTASVDSPRTVDNSKAAAGNGDVGQRGAIVASSSAGPSRPIGNLSALSTTESIGGTTTSIQKRFESYLTVPVAKHIASEAFEWLTRGPNIEGRCARVKTLVPYLAAFLSAIVEALNKDFVNGNYGIDYSLLDMTNSARRREFERRPLHIRKLLLNLFNEYFSVGEREDELRKELRRYVNGPSLYELFEIMVVTPGVFQSVFLIPGEVSGSVKRRAIEDRSHSLSIESSKSKKLKRGMGKEDIPSQVKSEPLPKTSKPAASASNDDDDVLFIEEKKKGHNVLAEITLSSDEEDDGSETDFDEGTKDQ